MPRTKATSKTAVEAEKAKYLQLRNEKMQLELDKQHGQVLSIVEYQQAVICLASSIGNALDDFVRAVEEHTKDPAVRQKVKELVESTKEEIASVQLPEHYSAEAA